MKKISTLFKKDPNDLGLVINEIDPANEWAITEGVPTRKFDGSACAIIKGELYRRYDAKKGKQPPAGAIPCQEPDLITGHWPHWVKCKQGNPVDKYFLEAFEGLANKIDGTYELCGEKVQSNPEHLTGHVLIKHGEEKLYIPDYSFEGLRQFLEAHDIEGIVWHHPDGRMCKLRKGDFRIKR